MNVVMQSVIGIVGLCFVISTGAVAVITKLRYMIIIAVIASFLVGAYISELGAKGKEMGLIK